MNTEKIATKLKENRINKHLTLKELADILECSESLPSMWENKKRIPSDKQKIKLAELYNTTVGSLFYDE